MDKIAVFKRLVAGTNWSPVMQIRDPVASYRLFLNIMKDLYDIAFPVVAVRKHQKSRKPWIDSCLLKRIKERDKLFSLFIKTGDLDALVKYKKIRNKPGSDIKQARAAYYENMFASVSDD